MRMGQKIPEEFLDIEESLRRVFLNWDALPERLRLYLVKMRFEMIKDPRLAKAIEQGLDDDARRRALARLFK